MKLKTLKDLVSKDNMCEGQRCSYDIMSIPLRQEAIKWVKELTKESFITNPKLNNKELTNSKASTIAWIEHFFNITEEDIMKQNSLEDEENG